MIIDAELEISEQVLEADFSVTIESGSGGGDSGDYDEGYADGYEEGQASYAERDAYIVSSTNSELESIGVSTIEGVLEIPIKIDEVYDKGEADGYNKGVEETEAKNFWTKYLGTCNSLFHKSVFPSNTELTFELPSICTTVTQMFQETQNLVSVKLTGTASITGCFAQAMFRYNYSIKKVDLSECYFPFGDWYMAFHSCIALEEIIGELDDCRVWTNNFTNAFASCIKLKEVRFAEGAIFQNISFVNSNLLSDASIQSIINGLDDLSGATAKTLTFHKDVGNKLTQAQKDAITAKNWTLAY